MRSVCRIKYSYDVKDFEQFARTRSVSSIIWEETVREFREYLSYHLSYTAARECKMEYSKANTTNTQN